MQKRTLVASVVKWSLFLWISCATFAQGIPGETQAPQTPPLFFRESWKETAEVPVTQAFLSNSDLELELYGPGKGDLQVVGSNTNKANPPHIWTGLCAPACALALRNKEGYVDLSGGAKIQWLTKVAGFHVVRPIIKLADGTWLVGDHVDAYTDDWHESEFLLSSVRWRRLDIEKVITIGDGKWIDHPDLSRIDEIGFAELMQGSGHGNNGYSDVAWIEVYGKSVPRTARGRADP
jgi:hypothetical protein